MGSSRDNVAVKEKLGQYQVLRQLGAGASGEVYLARHTILERQYAVKVLRSEYVDNEEFRERFFQEARLAAQLVHDNIVQVITADQEGEDYYLVMEYIEGPTLEDQMQGRPMAAWRAARYVGQVLAGLGCAHEAGMLHRDVKAENVLVSREDDQAKLVDFGLVKALRDSRKLTAVHAVVGTPYYMSPEQWRSEELDVRADLFSAGVLLYYLLTASFPFPGQTAISVAHRLSTGPHEPLGELELEGVAPQDRRQAQEQIEQIVGRALARERGDRFSSALDFAQALANWRRRFVTQLNDEDVSRIQSEELTQEAEPVQESSAILARMTSHGRPVSTPIEVQEMHEEKKSPDLVTEPVEIAENTYWVGKRPPNEIFFANPYLRHFEGKEKGAADFNLIVDPGSSKDFSTVQAKVTQILGSVNKISSIFINHQDPDVASSVGLLLGRYSPKAHVLCTEDTWRLVHYYNIPRNRFVALERFPRGIKLPTGDVVVPVPSPFCHFVGAMMLYDPHTRVLFSGDLFGALTEKGAKGIYADESDWPGMRAFHQIYMPTQKAVRHAIENIRALDPPVEIIAPQHGRVIEGEWVQEFMERLWDLPVGLDIMDDRNASPDELLAWTTVLTRIVDVARSELGDEAMKYLAADPNLRGIVTVGGGGLQVSSLGKTTVERAVRILVYNTSYELGQAIKFEAVYAAGELGLPTPAVELDEDGAGADDSSSGVGVTPEGFGMAD